MLQMASVGPMFGQHVHFSRFAPKGNDYGVGRYRSEVLRLFDLLEQRLTAQAFTGGSEYTIADMAFWPWVRNYELLGIDISSRPHVAAWVKKIGERDGIKRALAKVGAIDLDPRHRQRRQQGSLLRPWQIRPHRLTTATIGSKTMRAAIFRGGEIVVDTLPDPVPGKGQVLVKTLACGICGSDLHARKHAHRMVELTKFLSGTRKPMDLSRDVVMGHEFCCEVLDYGPGSERRFKPGTRVCSVPGLMTPTGPQGIGYSNENVGGYAERMILSEPLLLEVPNGLSAEHAALTEPLAVGIHAVEKANVRGDEVPLVIGCGPVGLIRDRGAEAEGPAPDRCRRLFAGAAQARRKAWRRHRDRSGQTQPFKSWEEHAQMTPEQKAARPPAQVFLPPLKPALIFECVGVPGVIQQIFESAPRDARIVVVGVCMESDRNEPMLGIMKELNVQYVLGYTPAEFASSLKLIADGKVEASSLITAKVGIDGVAKAFDDLGNPEQHTKIIVEPWR